MDWVRTEVDGVPTFWSEYDGDLRAGLVFRVGVADETLSRRGITHLVEHLALHGLSQSDYHANGEVDTITTTFHTHGSAESVTDFLGGVCHALGSLPTDRLAMENRILRTEEAGRGGGPARALSLWRYGAATYGLPGYEELGVGHHTAEELQAWSQKWFTRANAVLWLVGGPPPDGLRLPLPEGERIAPPPPSSALVRTPAYFQSDIDGVGFSAVLDRSVASTGYTHLLATRLRQALRHERGLSYSPATGYDPRDRDNAHLVAFADCLPEAHSKLVAGFVEEIDRLVDEPVSEKECASLADRLREPTRSAGGVPGMTLAAARDELLGGQPLRLSDYLTLVDALTPQQLNETAGQARDSALLMLPDGQVPPGRRYVPAPYRSAATVDGQVLVAARTSTPRSERTIGRNGDRRDRLIIGPEGISLVTGHTFVTVGFTHCQVVLAWPDGARNLIGVDGFRLHVEPNLWQGGDVLPGAIDAGVDPTLVLHQPARSPEEIPAVVRDRWQTVRTRLTRRQSS